MIHSFFHRVLMGMLILATLTTLAIGGSSAFALSVKPIIYSSQVQDLQAIVYTGSATLSWQPVYVPSGAYPVVDYVIQYRTSRFLPFIVYREMVSSDTHAELSNLAADTTYYVRVAAKNQNGTRGRFSSVIKIDTQKGKPEESKKPSGAPTAPRNISALAATLSANVTFTSPENTGKSAIQYYTIISSPENKMLKYIPTTQNGTFSTKITGLTAGNTYTFTITATNAFGTSIPSVPSNSVYIAAASGGGGGGGGGGTTYTYSWYTSSWGTCSLSCGGGTQTRTVECRRNDGIAVTDGYCISTKPSLSQSCNTSACTNTGDTTAPTSPTNLTATVISSSQIDLSWRASTDTGGVTGYRIYRNGSSVGTSSTTSYQNTGLSPSTQYTFTVRAYDAAGNTSVDSSSVSTTTQTSPSASGATILGLSIPSGHPRLWWNADRLTRARTWYTTHPFTPSSSNPIDQALHCLISGSTTYCQQAVDYAMNTLCSNAACTNPDPNIGVAADDLRWYAESVILIYDWLYDRFTPTQRQTLIDRWNGYFANVRLRSWGGPIMHQSNYNWGYMRNEIEWGIATWGENSQAETNLRYGLETRWMNNFVPHSTAVPGGKGGVFHEGSNYGASIADYSVVPFLGAAVLGRDIFSNDSPYFKESVFYIIYSTTPEPTWQPGLTQPTYEVFPFADDERFWEGGYTTTRGGYANLMLALSGHWGNLSVGQYAKAWYNKMNATAARFIQSVDTNTTPGNLNTLPLDYYAAGPQYFFGKTSWNSPSTAFVWQMGRTQDEGHRHNDVGTWQLWRSGRWLSRETTGYYEFIMPYNNSGTTVNTNTPVAHNSLLVNGRGPVQYEERGPSITRRLESRNEYAYASVDLTPVYTSDHYYYANPDIQSVEREYIFLRGLETLLIFDRVGTTSTSDTKTFLAHFEGNPTVNTLTKEISYTSGNQSLFMKTLLPASPTYRMINEGGAHGQYRLELETSGNTQTYFLNVLQARGSSEANISASIIDNGTSYTVNLSHPTKGSASLTLNKGMTSTGGSLTIGSNPYSLTSSVQNMTVTDDGPVWQ